MAFNPPAEFCQNVRSQSTTSLTDPGKIRTGRKAQARTVAAGGIKPSPRRTIAEPPSAARIYGPKTPVSVVLTYHGGSEPWVEVRNHQGRFWVIGTGSVLDLVNRIIAGGFPIQPTPDRSRRRRVR
jgi:hypothetical protein